MDGLLFGFNEVDLAILGAIFLSGAFAYIRGFSWEIVSLFSWVITLVAVWYLSWSAGPWIGALMTHYLGWSLPYFVVVGISALVIFLGMTMLLGPTTSFVMKGSLNMRLSFMDRFFGFCYGALRGFLVTAVIFLLYAAIIPEQEYPTALKNAKLYITLQDTTAIIKDMLPIPDGNG